jgi:hypothetical protein
LVTFSKRITEARLAEHGNGPGIREISTRRVEAQITPERRDPAYHSGPGPLLTPTSRDRKGAAMDLTSCPDCGGLSDVVDRHVLESTDGPIEHARVRCVRRHHFFLPLADLTSPVRLSRSRNRTAR